MTLLCNDPDHFTDDAMLGFCDLYPQYVRAVDGGVVRSVPGPEGKVAVVVGGGSGHYPAFCGLVGSGFADAAVVGNVFTAPSAQQARTVVKAADRGGGVLFGFGNYAGDTMNFGAAQERLRAEGIECRTVVVTDDIASAPSHEMHRRRGIAGDFAVFKVTSSAADEGLSLDAVERVATRANERTRTLGVAFDGCTLPGQRHPLFTVPTGTMGLGLGIHGEPGISEVALPTAADLADVLVDGVLAEAPSTGSDRVAVILNGLGASKHEEMFVLWSRVASRLRGAGFTLVEPEVGELVTSLDMVGVSLTVLWLDEELERLWCAPADAPAYRKGRMSPIDRSGGSGELTAERAEAEPTRYPVAGSASQACATTVVDVLAAIRRTVDHHADELGRIDAVAADGDHGRGMAQGARAGQEAAAAALSAGAGAQSVLAEAADAWAARAGGTSGALWGAGLRAFAECLGNERSPRAADLVAGVQGFLAAVRRIGNAELGDKTMVDALVPLARAFATGAGWQQAARAAREAAEKTAELAPRTGRARPLAERSVGTPDAGAVSLALIAEAVADVLEGQDGDHE